MVTIVNGEPISENIDIFDGLARCHTYMIEQEFKYAEKTEFWRLKEEEEMRRTIQVKREQALLDAKRIERARRIKEENRIRKGIISAVKNQPSADGAHQMLDMYAALPDPVAFPADSCF